MKRLMLIGLAYFLSSCAAFMNPPDLTYRQAMRYPPITRLKNIYQMSKDKEGEIKLEEHGYDCDRDGVIDLTEVYIAGSGVFRNGIFYKEPLTSPIEFIWGDREKPYARQFDSDGDGNIDSMSGNPKRLNKNYDKFFLE